MVHTQKAEQMFSRSTLKVFLWLSLFVLQSDSSSTHQKMTVTAKVGDEAKLPCSTTIPVGNFLESYMIYWQKEVGNEKPDLVVMAYVEGKEDTDKIDLRYRNRTKMNKQNLTLSISSVKISDEGTYKCLIIKEGKDDDASVNLTVVANFSKPVIYAEKSLNACGPTQLTLNCFSHGGYPEPEMFGSINNKSVKWNTSLTVDNQTKLLNVTGHMQLNVTEDIFVQCSVVCARFQETASLIWSITKECPLPTSPASFPPHGIIIASSVIFVFLVVVLTIVIQQCTCKYSRSSHPRGSSHPVATIDVAPQQQLNGKSEGVSF